MNGRVSTGIRGLDEVLHGGFLPQSAVLVRGAPGVGKTSLGLQFLYQGAAKEREPVLLVSFEEFPDSIYRDALSLGWDFRELEKQDLLHILFTSPRVFLSSLESPISPLSELIRQFGIRRLVLDSMTHFQKLGSSTEALRRVYGKVVNAIRREGITSMLLSEAANTSSLLLDEVGSLLFLVDAVILLSFVETDSVMSRALTVLKMRGSDHAKEIQRFEIGQGGITLKGRFEGHEGILTGVPRLSLDLVSEN